MNSSQPITKTTADGKKITIIPANRTKESQPLYEREYRKTRVCAYARVSTELDEQQSSYEAQIKYYRDFITKNEAWEFVGIYADEGISGTSTKHREEFNRMIADAKAGKIDLILTKSISRFARNTLDTIQITRDLKKLGVEVYFEKENLKSMDATTEVQLTILSSLAQDESRSLSQNVSWGIERRMREGKFTLAWSRFLGYDKGPDGLPVINEEQAEIVRTIYDLYLAGKTSGYIANYLEEQNIPSPRGKSKWHAGTIMSILKNEKYKGDAKLHKTFVADFLTKEVKKNNGEVSQYYVTNSHPAIIEPAVFDLVQKMIKNNAKKTGSRNNTIAFNDKLLCKKCGAVLTRKKRQKNGKENVSWNCYAKYDYTRPASERCDSKPVYEPEIKNGYIIAMRDLNARKGELLAKYADRIAELESPENKEKLKQKVIKHEDKLEAVQNDLHELMTSNSSLLNAHGFKTQHNKLTQLAIDEAEKLEQAKIALNENSVELVQTRKIKEVLENLETVTYTDELFMKTIDNIIVSDNHLEYVFYGGEKVKIIRNEKRGSYDEIIE